MKITIITYDAPHAKTEKIFWYLYNQRIHDLSFLFVPYVKRPDRKIFFQHRPEQFLGISIRQIARSLGVQVYEFGQRHEALQSDYLVICGANLLGEEFAESGKVINCHAGLIPFVRGLDSFKWAVKKNKIVGNTLHIINKEADSGKILHHLETPVFRNDTLKTFAQRHYENEIWLLQRFPSYLAGGNIKKLPYSDPTMRMPLNIEASLHEDFELYKLTHAKSEQNILEA